MKYLGMICLLVVCIGCSAPKVVYDYNPRLDFSVYKTYNYYPEMESGLNELDLKRIVRHTDSILQSRGFIRTATPDFYVNVTANAVENNQNSAVGVGFGGGGRNSGGGISVGLPVGSKRNQELVFDLVDVRKDELFWQAVAEGYYRENATPQERSTYFKNVLLKVFEEFPPLK